MNFFEKKFMKKSLKSGQPQKILKKSSEKIKKIACFLFLGAFLAIRFVV